jgi:hypothetical protein
MVKQDDMEESHAAFPDLQRSLELNSERFVFILFLTTFLAQKLSINLNLRILAIAKLSI